MFVPTTGFTRGEVDAPLWDRMDVDFYRSAVKYMEDWLPDLTGAVTRRPPWAFVDSLASPSEGETPVLYAGNLAGQDCLIYLHLQDSTTMQAQTFLRRSDGSFSTASQTFSCEDGTGADLASKVCFVQAGPAVFLTSALFPPRRFYIDTGALTSEKVTWYEELLGTVEVQSQSTEWTGTDTLFDEQLAVGDTFYFLGQAYTVDSITDNTTLETEEAYTGPSVGGVRLSITTDVFDSPGSYPHLVTFHRGRLFLFTTDNRPVHMWASSAGDPFVIVPGSVYDDAPIEAELLADGADAFRRVSAFENLFLGSAQGEFVLSTPADVPLTPTSIAFSKISSAGSAAVVPVQSEATVYFVTSTRKQVVGSVFDDSVRGYRTADVTVLAPHLMEPAVRQLALRPATSDDRTQRLFALTSDGNLRACALQESENVAAWSRVTAPGPSRILAVAATATELYAAIEGGSGGVYLSALTGDGTDRLDYAWQATDDFGTAPVANVPAHLRGASAAVVSSIRGLVGHTPPLGATVDLSDYGWRDGRGETMTLGLPYRSRLELLPAAAEDPQGPLLNRVRRMVRAMVSVRDTAHLIVNGQPLTGAVGTEVGQRLTPRTAVLTLRSLGWGHGEEVVLETSSIYPAQVLSVVREIVA